MTLYEYLKNNKNEEITVTDLHYDCENYWYYSDDNDLFEKSLMEIAKKLDIVKILDCNVIVCNISEIIKNNLDTIKNSDLFITIKDENDVMYNFDMIVSGYVSENWIYKFSKCLK